MPAAPYRIAQVDYGTSARFALCLPPACPISTPKHAPDVATAGTLRANWSSEKKANADGAMPQVPPSPLSTPANLLTIHYPSGQFALDSTSRRAIAAMATGVPVGRLLVAGRTDATGSLAVNRQIARSRANCVVRYLRSLPSIAAVAVETDASPLCCYIAPNDDAHGRRLNRRVDITLIPLSSEGAP